MCWKGSLKSGAYQGCLAFFEVQVHPLKSTYLGFHMLEEYFLLWVYMVVVYTNVVWCLLAQTFYKGTNFTLGCVSELCSWGLSLHFSVLGNWLEPSFIDDNWMSFVLLEKKKKKKKKHQYSYPLLCFIIASSFISFCCRHDCFLILVSLVVMMLVFSRELPIIYLPRSYFSYLSMFCKLSCCFLLYLRKKISAYV